MLPRLVDDVMDSDCCLVSLDLVLVTVISTDKPELLSKVFTCAPKLTLDGRYNHYF